MTHSNTHKVALITGGNRGIGLATVERFAREGYRTILSARDSEHGKQQAAILQDQGLDVLCLTLDVGERSSIHDAVATLAEQGIKVDILINNAGILPDGDLLALSEEEIIHSTNINLLGPLYLTRALAPAMIDRGYGRIVNVSSSWGSFAEGLGGPGMYGVTKAALNALTVRLSRDLPASIKVNAMHPGWVHSRMGGSNAPVTPQQAADTAFWLGTLGEDGPNGGFYYERKVIGW